MTRNTRKKPAPRLSHLDASGRARMVNISGKPVTRRVAGAAARITMSAAAFRQVVRGRAAKGDVLAVANLAGIQAAKRTADLIPLCHPLRLAHIEITFRPDPGTRSIGIEATCRLDDRTGVEMEALTAVTVAALTIYDMVKAVDQSMVISDVRLLRKSGGRSGSFKRTGA